MVFLKSDRKTTETMIGCVKQLQAFIAVSQALPQYGAGLLPARPHYDTRNPYNVEKQ